MLPDNRCSPDEDLSLPEEATDDAPQPPTGAAPVDRSGADRLLGGFEWAAAASLGVAFLVGVVASVRQGWVPVSDDALIVLHVMDVPSHPPLIGTYSRFGWSHPGPAEYYYLALPYRLFASSPAGLMVGTLVLSFGGTLWAWLVARRSSRVAGALVLAAMTLVMLGRDAIDLRDPWNPYVGVMLTGTLMVIAWAAAEGRPGSVFALLPLGSFLVQAHAGYAPIVVALTGVVVVVAVRSKQAFPFRAALGGMGLGFLMWLPPLLQRFTGDPWNLWEVAFSAYSEGSPAGYSTATQVLFAALAVPPTWLGRHLPLLAEGVDPSWTVPLLGIAPVSAATVVTIRRDRAKAPLMLVCAAAMAGYVMAVSRIAGPVHEYLFSGLGVTAALVVALSTWVLLDTFCGAEVQRRCALVCLGIVVVASIPVAVAQWGAEYPYPSSANGVGAIAEDLISDAADEAVYIEAVPEFTAYAALPGFVLALEEAGVDVAVPKDAAREFGEHRTAGPQGRTRYLVAFPGMVPSYLDDGWRLVGEYDPLPADVSASVAALDAEFKELLEQRAELTEEGLDTSEVSERIEENRDKSYDLRAERFPVAVLRAPE